MLRIEKRNNEITKLNEKIKERLHRHIIKRVNLDEDIDRNIEKLSFYRNNLKDSLILLNYILDMTKDSDIIFTVTCTSYYFDLDIKPDGDVGHVDIIIGEQLMKRTIKNVKVFTNSSLNEEEFFEKQKKEWKQLHFLNQLELIIQVVREELREADNTWNFWHEEIKE